MKRKFRKCLSAVPALAEETGGVKNGLATVSPTNHRPQAEARESNRGSDRAPHIPGAESRGGAQNIFLRLYLTTFNGPHLYEDNRERDYAPVFR